MCHALFLSYPNRLPRHLVIPESKRSDCVTVWFVWVLGSLVDDVVGIGNLRCFLCIAPIKHNNMCAMQMQKSYSAE